MLLTSTKLLFLSKVLAEQQNWTSCLLSVISHQYAYILECHKKKGIYIFFLNWRRMPGLIQDFIPLNRSKIFSMLISQLKHIFVAKHDFSECLKDILLCSSSGCFFFSFWSMFYLLNVYWTQELLVTCISLVNTVLKLKYWLFLDSMIQDNLLGSFESLI
jgi:hypothetical protein